jgi:hypothetical protein
MAYPSHALDRTTTPPQSYQLWSGFFLFSLAKRSLAQPRMPPGETVSD